jgi:hypothetical protein
MQKYKSAILSILFILFIVFSIGLFGITMFLLGTSVDESLANNKSLETKNQSRETIVLQGKNQTLTQTPTGTLLPTKAVLTLVVKSDKNLDGYRSSNKTGNETKEIMVGRNTEAVTRGFVSFPLNRIPANAVVKKATLRLYQIKIEGNPISSMGGLFVDHLFYGNVLDDTDYAMPALLASAFEIQRSRNSGWKETEVTSALVNDISLGRGVTQFRIHFEQEVRSKEGSDYVYFESGEATSGGMNAPELFIEYTR